MKLFSFLFLAVSFLASTSVFARLTTKAKCMTADGEYKVMVLANEGIGYISVPTLEAAIVDSKGNVVADYPVFFDNPSERTSPMETPTFKDKETQGKFFQLSTGKENVDPSLKAALTGGDHAFTTLSVDKLTCQFFGLDQLPFNND